MGRPSKVSDEQVFSSVLKIVLDLGVENFSLERLAVVLGVRRSTLTNRFKNKLELLRLADAYYLRESANDKPVVIASPLNAIITLLSAEMRFAVSAKTYMNGLGLLLLCLKDDRMNATYRQAFDDQQHKIKTLLERAKAEHLIKPGTDCAMLAQHLQVVQQGASHLWVMSQNGTIGQCIAAQLNEALKPYKII